MYFLAYVSFGFVHFSGHDLRCVVVAFECQDRSDCNYGLTQQEEVEEVSGDSVQQWVGKDFFNPFIKDFVELDEPFGGMSKLIPYFPEYKSQL